MLLQLQVTDAQGNPVSGIRLTSPLTIIYHYQPGELEALDLDPSGVLLSWTGLLSAARAAQHPSGSAGSGTWYFLSGAGNVSDRLVPASQSGFYQTLHISHLRIHQVTSSDTGQLCFQVYDTSGTFYEFGCTSDALQFWTET